MTQTERVLELLRTNGPRGVTPLDALEIVGSFRLGARIFDLRAEGHLIDTETTTTPGGAKVARYILRDPRPGPMTGVQEAWLR